MESSDNLLILLGSLFLVTLVVSPIAKHLKVPRVSLFILCGFAINYFGTEQLNGQAREWFGNISNITLLFIGYLLGAKMTRSYLKQYASRIITLSILITLATFCVVGLGTYFILGAPIVVALMLAAIAVATDPAATLDVIKESKLSNKFTGLLEGIVALDDAIALIVFSFVLAFLGLLTQIDTGLNPLLTMLWELVGAVIWGGLAGYLLVYLLGKKESSHSVFVESLGLILFCGGVALAFEFSFLLSAMVMGAVVVNFADDTQEHIHDIEFFEQPLLVLFFIMAGASLDLTMAKETLLLASIFILLRILGRYASRFVIPASTLSGEQRSWLGLALLPQAGIAMGMALLAGHHFPDYQSQILAVVVTSTIFFEIFGPLVTHFAVGKTRKR